MPSDRIAQTESYMFMSHNIFMLADDAEYASELACPNEIQFYAVNIEQNGIVFRRVGTEEDLSREEVSFVLTSFIGAFSYSLTGAKKLAKALRTAVSKESEETIEVATFDRKTHGWEIEFAKWIQHALLRNCRESASNVTRLQKTLYALRKEHARTQDAFSKLESFAARHLATPDLYRFIAEPSGKYVVPGKSLQGIPGTLEQVLPVPSVGLSAIDLNFKIPSPVAKGYISIALTVLETRHVLGLWEPDYVELKDGWNTFILENSEVGIPHTVKLTLQWNNLDGEESVPAIAISSMNPLQEYRVTTFGAQSSVSSLAFRCREFTPGLRGPKILGGFITKHSVDKALPQPWVIDREHFKAAKEIGRPIRKGNSELVQALDGGHRLLVHPTSTGISAAILEDICPANIDRLAADVKTENESASEIHYGFAVVPSGKKFKEKLSAADLEQLGEHFSGWHPVKPALKTQLHLFLPVPTTSTCSVILMTTLGPGGQADNGWAAFLRLEFHPAAVHEEAI